MKKKTNCTCIVCNVDFYAKPSHIEKRGSGKYCSLKCKSESSKITSTCLKCGKEFKHIKSQKRKYCSKECQLDVVHQINTKIKPRECKVCGKEFKPTHDYIKYCSRECTYKAQDKRVEVHCNICGKKLLRKTCELKVNKFSVCSKECFKEHQRIKLEGNSLAKGHTHTQETKLHLSESMKGKFKDVGFRMKWKKSLPKEPNGVEKQFNDLTPDNVYYTGNGGFFIDLGFKTCIPDFIVTDSKKVIEIFGDYWHKDEDPNELIEAYSKVGFECLVFWEHELQDHMDIVLREVREFLDS